MDTERYLAEIFDALATAASQDAGVQIAVQAANELAAAYGMCLLTANGDDSLVALANRPQLYLCNLRNSGLYRAAASLRRVGAESSRTLWGKEDFITLPNGQRRSIRVALVVPMKASGHLAVSFFWQPGQDVDPLHARRVELVAKAFDLAAANWGKDRLHAEQKRDQQRISAEVQHRLRNNLALVRSIIRRSHETAESAEHFALHLETRIGALARIQGALVTAGSAGVDLEELIRAELLASAVPEQYCTLRGPAMRLHDKGAELLALAVHEMATNSLKFGALAAAAGRLEIGWSVRDDALAYLHLSWRESGVTIASSAPRRRGFGQELIECTLPYELGASTQLSFDPGVVLCEIRLPLEAYVSIAEPAVLVAYGAGAW